MVYKTIFHSTKKHKYNILILFDMMKNVVSLQLSRETRLIQSTKTKDYKSSMPLHKVEQLCMLPKKYKNKKQSFLRTFFPDCRNSLGS